MGEQFGKRISCSNNKEEHPQQKRMLTTEKDTSSCEFRAGPLRV